MLLRLTEHWVLKYISFYLQSYKNQRKRLV